MANNITEYNATPGSNTTIDSISIDEGMAASNVNNAIRSLMSHLKNVDTGSQAMTSPSFTAMSTDTISEKTSANGVSIDSVTLKDGELGTTSSPVPINSSSLNGGQFGGRRNMVINGSMQISQRRGTDVYAQINDELSLDRFKGNSYDGGIATGKYTVQQSSTAPDDFSHSLLVTSSASTADNANNIFNIEQRIEGYNTAHLNYGSSSAKTITLSFYVRSSLTGTFGGALKNSDRNRAYPFSYTINSADTFERKEITITGDTSGTWVGSTNGIGLWVSFGLGVGSTRSATAGAWGSGDIFSATGATSVVGTSGATWYITGVQLEVGEQATPFEHRSFGEELALCQRYYEKGNIDTICTFITSTVILGTVYFATTKRDTPTISYTTNFTLYVEASTPSISGHTINGTADVTSFVPRADSSVSKNGKGAFIQNGDYTADSEL